MRYDSGGGVYLEGLIFGILRYFFFLFWEVKLMKESWKTNTIVYCMYNVHRGYYTVARRYEFIFEWQNNILRTSAASD